MQANPIPTMVLGQAGVGAYSGYLDDKKDARDDEERKDRGTRGYAWSGNYAGNPGIVQSQQVVPQASTAQTVAGPTIAAPTVGGPNQAPIQRPVNRNNLPALQKQGLVAPQQRTV